MVAPGGHAWLLPGGGGAWDTTRYGDTINERAVRILLECILVTFVFTSLLVSAPTHLFSLLARSDPQIYILSATPASLYISLLDFDPCL